MYELIQASGNSYYVQSPAKVGLVRLNERDVCLIDSGGDREAGRRLKRLLDAQDWRLTAVYNTHSNADHIGGNHYLQGQTGCRIYAPGIECAFTRHPILESAFLCGGYPPAELKHKFLMARESDAEYLTPETLPEGFELIPLPGHFFDMVGFRTPDDVVYLADCLNSRETIAKYKIGFIYDVAAYLETLERVKALRARLFVPAHADAAEDIAPLAQFNIDAVLEIGERIEGLCAEPKSFERLLARLFEQYELKMSFEQHALVGCTVRSYLAWLKEAGRIEARFEDNTLIWARL